MKVYKALSKNGYSPFQSYQWPLPKGRRPGKWVEVKGTPELCKHGLHGYLTLKEAKTAAPYVYEMELDGEIVQDSHKAAGRRARLLRLIHKPPEPKPEPVPAGRIFGDPIERARQRRRIQREAAKRAAAGALRANMSMVCATGERSSGHKGIEAHAFCKGDTCLCECHDSVMAS